MHMMQALQKIGTAFVIESICAVVAFVFVAVAASR